MLSFSITMTYSLILECDIYLWCDGEDVRKDSFSSEAAGQPVQGRLGHDGVGVVVVVGDLVACGPVILVVHVRHHLQDRLDRGGQLVASHLADL